ncbi:Carbohydrate esterase family 4 protein [Mycena sanguinolenta]|uniref:chitin deacetylase n=1 Tax=Mycena sanguinolenta TaxID=230812 RepID=A0A8H6XRS9_9AGAR|nr:Carbohydrate esterase family 4 protein [Mycena sanguinolenta]
MHLALPLLAFPLLSSAAVLQQRHDHSHNVERRLPSAWYQPADHPVHSLFRRDGATDGVTYAPVGSAEWAAGYPPDPPKFADVTTLPAEWVAALNDAIARNAIPNTPLSKNTSSGVPVYPKGQTISVSSFNLSVDIYAFKVSIPTVLKSAPRRTNAKSLGTADLVAYLETVNQQVTHFMIGSNIRDNPDLFTQVFNLGNDIAVHTWTHPYMTTLSNELVLAELGWTMQIIHNSTGGRVPRFWRPPYGDSDTRVSAIAKEVFGLTTIVWNQDTNDWSLTDSPPGTTQAKINASMYEWLTGPTTPGLIILEHELSNQSVSAFKSAYPVMQQHTQWTIMSLAQLVGNGTSYQNADNSTSPVNAVDIINAKSGSPPSASSASPPQSGSSTASASPSSTPGSKQNSASSRWEMGPMATLMATALIFMLWT